jgi:CTP-dependent riboflavin kinase
MTGVIFSDLGLASSFMALDWVQLALQRSLGFTPFPATLNIRPKDAADAETWRFMRSEGGMPLLTAESGFCSARLYPIEIFGAGDERGKIPGAILVPEVKDYPGDKIEIVAPVRLKDHLGVHDGDPITLEFLN